MPSRSRSEVVLPALAAASLALVVFVVAFLVWQQLFGSARPATAAGAVTVTRNYQAPSTSSASFRDSYNDSWNSGSNFGSNSTFTVKSSSSTSCTSGGGPSIRCDRGFVWFDLGGLPGGSTVSSVSVDLTATSGSTGRTHGLHKVSAAWVEGEVTWYNRTASAAWATEGGDFNGSASQTTATGTSTGVKTFGNTGALRTDVSGWINNPATNYGWLVRDQGETDQSNVSWSYAAKEDATQADRPKLSVSFTAPWDSYSDTARTTVSDSFSTSPNTVYMRGSGFSGSYQYNVAYYDAGGTKRFEEGPLSVSSGKLDSAVTTSNYPSASAGTWHAVVQRSGGTSLPATYSSINADTHDVLANDSFTVQASALPEFPSVIAALGAVTVAGAGYYGMRRRANRRK